MGMYFKNIKVSTFFEAWKASSRSNIYLQNTDFLVLVIDISSIDK